MCLDKEVHFDKPNVIFSVYLIDCKKGSSFNWFHCVNINPQKTQWQLILLIL